MLMIMCGLMIAVMSMNYIIKVHGLPVKNFSDT